MQNFLFTIMAELRLALDNFVRGAENKFYRIGGSNFTSFPPPPPSSFPCVTLFLHIVLFEKNAGFSVLFFYFVCSGFYQIFVLFVFFPLLEEKTTPHYFILEEIS